MGRKDEKSSSVLSDDYTRSVTTENTIPITGAALLENNEATAKSTSQAGGMAVNFG